MTNMLFNVLKNCLVMLHIPVLSHRRFVIVQHNVYQQGNSKLFVKEALNHECLLKPKVLHYADMSCRRAEIVHMKHHSGIQHYVSRSLSDFGKHWKFYVPKCPLKLEVMMSSQPEVENWDGQRKYFVHNLWLVFFLKIVPGIHSKDFGKMREMSLKLVYTLPHGTCKPEKQRRRSLQRHRVQERQSSLMDSCSVDVLCDGEPLFIHQLLPLVCWRLKNACEGVGIILHPLLLVRVPCAMVQYHALHQPLGVQVKLFDVYHV